jgi:hypothetical protein
MSNPLIGQVRAHPVYRDCSFVVTRLGSANFFGPDHKAEAEAFANLVVGAKRSDGARFSPTCSCVECRSYFNSNPT